MRGIGGVVTPQYIRCTSEGLKCFTLAGKNGGGNRIRN